MRISPRQILARLGKVGWQGLMVGVVALSVLLLAVAWGSIWDRLDAERQLVVANAVRQQENLAHIIGENLTQIVERCRLIALAAEPAGGGDGHAGRTLTTLRGVEPAILRIELYDLHGRRIFASASAPDAPNVLAAVRQLLASPADDAERMRVLPPRDVFGQNWEIPLLFPVLDRAGQRRGVLLAVLDTGYFLGVYRRIDFGASGVIGIAAADGQLLAEADRAGMAVVAGRRMPGLGPQREAGGRTHSETVEEGGRSRLQSIHRLGTYPLAVSVSRDLQELLAEQGAARQRVLSLLIWFSVVLVATALWILGNFRRQGRLLRSLEASNRRNEQLIGQLEEERNRAFTLAAHDHLTGLNNRRMFHELVSSHLSRAKRSRQYYALVFLDLDRFKNINDTLGHHVGDLLLQVVAGRLRACVRESDVVARLGGDEFAALLTGLASIADAERIAAKLIEQIGQPCHDLDGHDLHVTPSIGIALFPRDGHDFESLCRSADNAMYQAKHNGRGRYVFYDPSLNRLDERQFELDQRLPGAISEGELVLHYQPKIRLSDHRVVGLEALVRWQHSELGLIYPNDFIPLAEAQGAIGALGDWVAEAVCRQLAAWRAAGVAVVPVAINVAPAQLLDGRLSETLAVCLARHDLPGSLLEVEVTENSVVDSLEQAGRELTSLQALGISVALDDFGSGYANFSYVRAMPIHRLKIDRSFISDIHKSRENSAIVDSIVSLAHRLGKKVVAEGVETRQQLIHLRTVGCDEVQGYFIGRPLPAEDTEPLLRRAILEPV